MKEIGVLGCGIQGRAVAFDLIKNEEIGKLVLMDSSESKLESLKRWLDDPRIQTRTIDLKQTKTIGEHLMPLELAVNCAPYEYVLPVTVAAIESCTHVVDLGGDTDEVLKQLQLNEDASKNGIIVIPDCGVSPGITNVLIGYAMSILDKVDTIKIRDGGIPVSPKPPLYYFKLFSIDVLLNEYCGKTTSVKDFKIVQVDGLDEVEALELPEPVGRVEATQGMGMLSTLPWTFQGKIKNMDNKLIRYPGHIQFFKNLKEVGFLERKAIPIGGQKIEPWEVTKAVLSKHLDMPDQKDLYAMLVSVEGEQKGKDKNLKFYFYDERDNNSGLSAMARSTGFTASIVAQLILDGTIKNRGVIPPELVVPPVPFFSELRKRGFRLDLPHLD